MRDPNNIFHLAIPCANIDTTKEFYVDKLGCKMGRRYDDRITLNFFGDQVVCHLHPDKVDKEPQMYPRHFGVTFKNEAEYDALLKMATEQRLTFYEKPFNRFPGKKEEHKTFFLIDPSNNLLEFKYYFSSEMMY